jgi:hypothetical protein
MFILLFSLPPQGMMIDGKDYAPFKISQTTAGRV